jgi:putative membrane-bound dehydrogenase-like protein
MAISLVAAIFLMPSRMKRNWIEVGEGYSINVPPGFTIERVAEPDRVHYPMMATLDHRGRLFVAESSGKNVKGKDMPANPECRIALLEDLDGDGVYEKSKVFADKLSLPMGALWHRGSLYVASPPDFIRLDDRDGDGVAEHREVLLTGWNILNTASLHGPFLGPDGLLYLTHGRHGYKIQTKEGPVLEGMAARIWRCREDGSELERVCGGGFDNPVELSFTPEGEMLGTMTYFTDPQNGQRDSLMHFVEGGVYPKPHPVIEEFKRTGDLMPVMSKFARIAPSGLLQYRGSGLGAEFKGNLFSAQFNPHRIQRHALIREGATFRTEDSDFVTSTDPDFHPTDVMEDADGSLLFLDTGGWYVDACPLSKISKAERKGAVYRIRKAFTKRIEDPRGERLKLDSHAPEVLVTHLEDARPAVRDRSLELLVENGEASVTALIAARDRLKEAEARCAAVFALGRIGSPTAIEAVRAALDDRDARVRMAAARVAGTHKDKNAIDRLLEMVAKDEAPVRRQAATSLGQIGDPGAAEGLIAAATTKDRFVEHAIIYSLIQLQAPAPLLAALDSPEPLKQKAALIALDQMDESPLEQAQAAALLTVEDADLRRAALWVISRHAEWGDAVIDFLQASLQSEKFNAAEAVSIRDTLVAFAANESVQALVAETLTAATTIADQKIFLLDTVERVPLKELPDSWMSGFARLLGDPNPKIQQRCLALIRARRLEGLEEQLTRIAANMAEPSDLRVAALTALVARKPQLPDPFIDFLLGLLKIDIDPALRLSAATCIGQAELSRERLLALTRQHLPQADSLTVLPLLDAYRGTLDDEIGQAMIAALQNPSINLEAVGGKRLEQFFKNFPEPTRVAARSLEARFKEEEASRIKRLRQLESLLDAGGDVGKGRNLFFGSRAACATCHTIGKEGGHVGPDLTSVGSIRSGHDILEAVVFPNATFVPGHESRRVITKSSNQIFSGVISEFESDRDTIVLISGPNDKLRIPRGDVASIASSSVSLMPDGFGTQLNPRELTDLLAFLRAQK